MKKFAIVDLSNLFFAVRYVVQGDVDQKAGMAFHIIFRSLRKLHRELEVDHIVFALDQGSWRYAHCATYKGKRKLDRLSKNEKEKEEDEIYFNAFKSLVQYLKNDTYCTVLQHDKLEADDFVAGWIQAHPEDEHIIVSADSDFVQLLDKNVKIYDGIKDLLISSTEIINKEGKKMAFAVDNKNGKIKAGMPDPNFAPEDEWWKYALFVKIIRGDSGDGILPSYPRALAKSSKNRIGFIDAWKDRVNKGYDWNNFMLFEWEKPDIKTACINKVRVQDEFKINEMLIDLTRQPDDMKATMFEVIDNAISEDKNIAQLGIRFLRFCGTHDLPELEKEAKTHTVYLGKKYNAA